MINGLYRINKLYLNHSMRQFSEDDFSSSYFDNDLPNSPIECTV